jgi:hypothetical protein
LLLAKACGVLSWVRWVPVEALLLEAAVLQLEVSQSSYEPAAW